jgi:hypothetical protein
MTARRKPRPAPPDQQPQGEQPPEPVNVVDGIPDRSQRAPRWRYLLIAAAFAAWLAFLVYCAVAGGA